MHVLSKGEAGFEDGTLNYMSIPAVGIGLRHLRRVGIETIQKRVNCLTDWLLTRLMEMQHSNGRAMVRLYGPANTTMRGGTVTMNFYDPNGHLIDYRRIEELAGEARISLRTGCFCNPGAGETAEDLNEADMRAGISELGTEVNLQRFLHVMQDRGGKSAGAIRLVERYESRADAIKLAAQLVAESPDFADGYAALAALLIRSGRRDEARRVLASGAEMVSDKERFERLKGTSQVMAVTRQRLARIGLLHAELPPLADIDEPADLARLPPGWPKD